MGSIPASCAGGRQFESQPREGLTCWKIVFGSLAPSWQTITKMSGLFAPGTVHTSHSKHFSMTLYKFCNWYNVIKRTKMASFTYCHNYLYSILPIRLWTLYFFFLVFLVSFFTETLGFSYPCTTLDASISCCQMNGGNAGEP